MLKAFVNWCDFYCRLLLFCVILLVAGGALTPGCNETVGAGKHSAAGGCDEHE